MTRCVYVASSEGQTGKAAIALGLIDALVKAGKSVGVFRPIVKDPEHDEIGAALLAAPGVTPLPAGALGVSYDDAHADLDDALADIVDHYALLEGAGLDVIVAVGTDWSDVSATTELEVNAKVAANLNAPIILAVNAFDRTPQQVRIAADNAVRAFEDNAVRAFEDEHNTVLAVIANRCREAERDDVLAALNGMCGFVAAIPEQRVLSAPSVRDQFAAAQATIINGTDARLDAESLHTLIGGMTLPNVIARMEPSTTVIAASDRGDLVEGLLSQASQDLAALILVGGFEMPAEIQATIKASDLPVATTDENTFVTAQRVSRLFGSISPEQPNKIAAAGPAFSTHVDAPGLVAAIDACSANIRTPLMFEHQLQAMAAADKKTIVLPEAMDDRILESAAIVNERGFANVILLGDASEIHDRASRLGFDLGDVQIISPQDPELVEKFAAKYAELRAAKGVTIEDARKKLEDLSYFGTMMIYFGMADGMVSGAVNTTANTIKPSFEFIKTKPGIKVVSSSFLMCLADRVLVFGDCAVNPNPTPDQLADIAISSAETAKRFGIEPRVAMLSYSTGTSGKGADVDAVAEATALAKERAPELKLDGPIQFDAAIDITVGSKKLPGSDVAGQATVFIFPDLNTGNNTYKAVQRSAGALAVGPVLQGLNKPVNDLSRGALVADIVNTVAITAIQAQDDAAATEGTHA